MVYIRIHRLTTGSVSHTDSKEDSWKSDAKYVLKEILIVPRGGGSLTNVQFYADLDGVPIFRPDIPAELFKPSNPMRHMLNFSFVKGSSFNYKLTNNSGTAETYDICLILETETWPPE